MPRDNVKANNPVIKKELEDLWDEIDSVASDAEAYTDGEISDALDEYVPVVPTGIPVNAVAAKSTLTFTGVVTDGETITVGDDVYEFAADAAQSVVAGNIAVDITASATASQGTLTLGVQPTAGDTMTIGTKVYTYVPVGTANADGEISVGADLPAAKLATVAAINGSDSVNTASTFVTSGAFAVDDAVLTALVAGTAGDAIVTTETFANGGNLFDAGTLGTTTAGVDCSAANAITATVGASAGGTEPVAITDGAGDTLVVTADVAGLAAESILTSTDCANGTFDVAHLDGGVNGTVGVDGQQFKDLGTGRVYVCFGANTVSGANWKSAVFA